MIFVFFISKGQREIINFQFIPSVESDAVSDRFLPDYPEVLAKKASPVPLISGVNNIEGLIIFGGKLFLN